MNQDNNQPALLLKVVLVMQFLTLLLFAWAYFANGSLRAEYKEQMKEYRARQADYEKAVQEYRKQMAAYNAQLVEWQKRYAAYTNSMSQFPKP